MATDQAEKLIQNTRHIAGLILGFDEGTPLAQLMGHAYKLDMIGRRALAEVLVEDDRNGDVPMNGPRKDFVEWVARRQRLEDVFVSAVENGVE